MKKVVLFSLGVLLLYACKDEVKEPVTRQTREITHAGEGSSHWDSLWVSGKDTVLISFSLEPIPSNFVVANTESDSFVDMHVYEDKRLRIAIGEREWLVVKDSLLKDINKEYLDEALIEDLQLMVFQPDAGLYLFEFSVRKPMEKDVFHYQGQLLNGELELTISDE